jgi:hypothetical protein
MITDIIKEQEVKIRQEMELPESAIEEIFENLGFLQGLVDLDVKRKIAKSMYAAYKFITSLEREGNSFDVIVLPLTRRIMSAPEYDGHILKGDELYLFMNEKKISDIRNFLDSMRHHPYPMCSTYKRVDDKEYLSDVYFHTVFDVIVELCGLGDKTLYEAINGYCENRDELTEREKHLLTDVMKIDFEAELTALIAEYFVFLHQLP